MGALLPAGIVSRYPTWSEMQLQRVGSSFQVMCESVGRGASRLRSPEESTWNHVAGSVSGATELSLG